MSQTTSKFIVIVGITEDLMVMIYEFTQNGGSDNLRKLIGEKLQGQASMRMLEQYADARVEAARQQHINDYLASVKAEKDAPVIEKIDEALNVPDNSGIATANQNGDNVINRSAPFMRPDTGNYNVDQTGGTTHQIFGAEPFMPPDTNTNQPTRKPRSKTRSK